MKQIILCRHTETEHIAVGGNKSVRNDSRLTERGKLQASEMRKFLLDNEYVFEAVFTSLNLRAVETAEVISKDLGVKNIKSVAFAEYFLRDDGTGVETIDMAVARTMTKIYSLFDQYESILIVAHSSVNKSILQNILNINYNSSLEAFNKLGEIQVLRYDWKLGDTKWGVVNNFVPA